MSATTGSSWADRNFGSGAATLRLAIVEALADACSRSQDAQDVSEAETKDPFGHTLKILQFQKLAEKIADVLPGRHRVAKLDRYSLVVVNNFVLYPVRSMNGKSADAKDGGVRRPVSKLRRRIFTALGPTPYQPPLSPEWADQAAEDLRTLISRLGKDIRLAAISYVCSFNSGLSDAYWGEAELNFRDGALIFHDGEKLAISQSISRAHRSPSALAVAGEVRTQRFDGGDLPPLNLTANQGHQTPVLEPESSRPETTNDER